jgi:hypothetical protein
MISTVKPGITRPIDPGFIGIISAQFPIIKFASITKKKSHFNKDHVTMKTETF